MTNYIANVYFTKEVEQDNYNEGCHGPLSLICEDKFTVAFENKQDLLNKLATWTAERFDISEEMFLTHVENECDNNRFDYAQPEDENGLITNITPENPDGYHAMYFYHIEVSQKVNYSF